MFWGQSTYFDFFLFAANVRRTSRPAVDANFGADAPGSFSLVWLWCGVHTEVGWCLGSTRNGVPDLG